MWVRQLQGFSVCTIDLPSIPTKERPRFNSKTRRTYTSRSTHYRERVIRSEWLKQVGAKWESFEGPVEVQILISRPIAKGTARRFVGSANTLKPDIDNTAKLVLDALNHYAYKDDKQITSLNVVKAPRIKAGEPASIFIRIDYYTEVFRDENNERA